MKKIIYRKKAGEPKEKKTERKAKSFSARLILYCFIVTAVLFGLLIFIEKSIINAEDTKKVFVSIAEVPEDVCITESNISEYFRVEERAQSVIPEGYISEISEIVGLISNRKIMKNEIITITSFSSLDERTKDIENPIEVSLNASNLAQVVGGVLRAGDYINIWSVKSSNVNGIQQIESRNICSHAYVTRTFTSSGEEVGRDGANSDTATMIINIIISAEQEDEFNKAIVEGTIRVGRCLDREASTDDDKDENILKGTAE